MGRFRRRKTAASSPHGLSPGCPSIISWIHAILRYLQLPECSSAQTSKIKYHPCVYMNIATWWFLLVFYCTCFMLLLSCVCSLSLKNICWWSRWRWWQKFWGMPQTLYKATSPLTDATLSPIWNLALPLHVSYPDTYPICEEDCISVERRPPANALLLPWPWPWPDDLDTWTCAPNDYKDVTALHK